MTIIAFLAMLVTLVAVGIDLALWIIMRRLLNDNGFNAMLVSVNEAVTVSSGLMRTIVLSSRKSLADLFDTVFESLVCPYRETPTGSPLVLSLLLSSVLVPPLVDLVDDSQPDEWVVKSTKRRVTSRVVLLESAWRDHTRPRRGGRRVENEE